MTTTLATTTSRSGGSTTSGSSTTASSTGMVKYGKLFSFILVSTSADDPSSWSEHCRV